MGSSPCQVLRGVASNRLLRRQPALGGGNHFAFALGGVGATDGRGLRHAGPAGFMLHQVAGSGVRAGQGRWCYRRRSCSPAPAHRLWRLAVPAVDQHHIQRAVAQERADQAAQSARQAPRPGAAAAKRQPPATGVGYGEKSRDSHDGVGSQVGHAGRCNYRGRVGLLGAWTFSACADAQRSLIEGRGSPHPTYFLCLAKERGKDDRDARHPFRLVPC